MGPIKATVKLERHRHHSRHRRPPPRPDSVHVWEGARECGRCIPSTFYEPACMIYQQSVISSAFDLLQGLRRVTLITLKTLLSRLQVQFLCLAGFGYVRTQNELECGGFSGKRAALDEGFQVKRPNQAYWVIFHLVRKAGRYFSLVEFYCKHILFQLSSNRHKHTRRSNPACTTIATIRGELCALAHTCAPAARTHARIPLRARAPARPKRPPPRQKAFDLADTRKHTHTQHGDAAYRRLKWRGINL